MLESERITFCSNIHTGTGTPAHTHTHIEPSGIRSTVSGGKSGTTGESIFLFEDLKEPFLEKREEASDVRILPLSCFKKTKGKFLFYQPEVAKKGLSQL